MARSKKIDFDKFLSRLKAHEDYRGQIEHERVFPAKKPKYAPLKRPLPDQFAKNLKTIGAAQLFTHQAEAINRVRSGEDIVIVTETASGKSLCYHLPVLETIHNEPDARALYIFPTKALSQDQSRSLHKLISPSADYAENKTVHTLKCGKGRATFGVYDGDTSREDRSTLRKFANIVLTNPDMLSLGILPNHSRLWNKFFSNLKYVVIDEMHIYRGVFGSHVANLIRRLERICEFHRARPQFICCSATTANPAEHAARLLNRNPTIISNSGAPSANKTFVLWNPPIYDKLQGLRHSSITESVNLFSSLSALGARTIVFARSKPTVEVILRFTRDKLKDDPGAYGGITSYRGGYMPEDRRKIERALSDGGLTGVTCTNALELGVDIGSLDAAVLNGYPGTIASTWQQAGRAGRRGQDSLSILVATAEPLDQYLIRNPDYFFDLGVENAIIDPFNQYIQSMHLKAAAYELPLRREEESLFGDQYAKRVRQLIKEGSLKNTGGRVICAGDDFPAQDINLRTSTAERFAILTGDGAQIGMMDAGTVYNYLHPGAVYLHQGDSFLVDRLDVQAKTAVVDRRNLNYYTRTLSRETVDIEIEITAKKFKTTPVFFGYVNVTNIVHSYKIIRVGSDEVIERVPLDFPPETLRTQSLWFFIDDKTVSLIKDKGLDIDGGLHALEHAAISMLPFLAMCDRDDIGGLSTSRHQDTGVPTVFIHDGYPGGVGLSEMGYKSIDKLLQKSHEMITGCPCADGCPSCIQSPKCGNMNEPLDKKAALLILKSILKIK